jgi:hypothetical protein
MAEEKEERETPVAFRGGATIDDISDTVLSLMKIQHYQNQIIRSLLESVLDLSALASSTRIPDKKQIAAALDSAVKTYVEMNDTIERMNEDAGRRKS